MNTQTKLVCMTKREADFRIPLFSVCRALETGVYNLHVQRTLENSGIFLQASNKNVAAIAGNPSVQVMRVQLYKNRTECVPSIILHMVKQMTEHSFICTQAHSSNVEDTLFPASSPCS